MVPQKNSNSHLIMRDKINKIMDIDPKMSKTLFMSTTDSKSVRKIEKKASSVPKKTKHTLTPEKGFPKTDSIKESDELFQSKIEKEPVPYIEVGGNNKASFHMSQSNKLLRIDLSQVDKEKINTKTHLSNATVSKTTSRKGDNKKSKLAKNDIFNDTTENSNTLRDTINTGRYHSKSVQNNCLDNETLYFSQCDDDMVNFDHAYQQNLQIQMQTLCKFNLHKHYNMKLGTQLNSEKNQVEFNV